MRNDGALPSPHSELHTPVIVNPTSGQGRALAHIEYIRARLETAGMNPEIRITTGRGDACLAAQEAVRLGCERVVIAGGDGTVNEVLNGLCEAPVSVGLIPVGTGNVMARDAGIPINAIAAACDIIVQGKTRTLDLAKADGRYFALMAGFGIDAAVVDRVIPLVKERLGIAAYGLAIVGALLKHRAAHFTIEADGKTVEVDAGLVIVANSGKYAYNIRVAPKAEMNDGLLDICIFAKAFPQHLALLHQAWHTIRSKHESDPNLIYLQAASVTVNSTPPVMVQIDGDTAGVTPRHIDIRPASLKLIVPG